jgi:YesN/AraC family two-component response regulator
MHSILLVDDERIELEALTYYVPWESLGIKVTGTAKNGREALELTQQLDPDIILTDVRMPIMDGIEFAKRAKQLRKRVKIVFLSGHDEFQYIKAALSVEASGYLLKPIDLAELEQLMEKVKLKCEEAKLTERSEEMAKEKLLRLLLIEEAPDRRTELVKKLLQLDATATPFRGPYKAAYLAIGRPSRDAVSAADAGMPDPFERSIGEAVHSRLRALGYIGELIDWEYGTFAGVFPASLFDGDRNIWLQLQKQMAEDFPVSLTIGLSSSSDRLEDAYTLLKDAHSAAEQAFYYGNGALLSAEEVREPATEEIEVEEHRASLCRTIGHQRTEETECEAAIFINKLRETHVHPNLARSAAVRLITALEQHFSGAFNELHVGPFSSEWEIMNNCRTLDDIGDHVLHVCHSLIIALSEKDKDRHQHIARHIQDIIDRSYHKPLTVEDIAKEVYLSPNYIRTIYKEKTGRTILEAITEKRMERASGLLADKSLKIHEIAGLVGYENVSYFCSIFHKTTGLTPNHYRKQIY